MCVFLVKTSEAGRLLEDYWKTRISLMDKKKLYVGGLPYNTTNEELSEAFAKAGTVVSASVVTDRMTGRSRGFGFVEMSTEEEAEAAVNMLNGQELGGRKLTVNVARPRPERNER